MKKNYIVKFYGFCNTYELAHCTDRELEKALSQGWEKITRRQAISLCVAERRREKYEPASSGFASSVILPLDAREWEACAYYDSRLFHTADGYVYTRAA